MPNSYRPGKNHGDLFRCLKREGSRIGYVHRNPLHLAFTGSRPSGPHRPVILFAAAKITGHRSPRYEKPVTAMVRRQPSPDDYRQPVGALPLHRRWPLPNMSHDPFMSIAVTMAGGEREISAAPENQKSHARHSYNYPNKIPDRISEVQTQRLPKSVAWSVAY